MPIIKRTDGAQFAIHTYRELLYSQKSSLLRNEIRLLAQSHGEYVRIFKQPNKSVEAVFSRDAGFLLGETIWQFLGKPQDLIYCEALPESAQALIVIVKSNTVYLDAKIPFASLNDEFAPLLTGNNQYDIYIQGNIPISNAPEDGKFYFNPDYVKSFNQLENSVFNQLPLDPNLQLQPLETALRSIQGPVSPQASALIILILIILGGWWWLQRSSEEKIVKIPARPVVVQQNPYQAFINALTTPAPVTQLKEMATVIQKLYAVPGWQITSVSYDGSGYQIKAQPMGGDLSMLQSWANANNIAMSITSNGPSLYIASALPQRPSPTSIPDLQSALITTIDRINHLLPSPSIQLGTSTSLGAANQADLTIQYNSISPNILALIGIKLNGLPVNLISADANLAQGLLSGTIKLNVLGK